MGRDARSLRSVRGKVVSYVPQDPGGALNPSLRVGDAIMDVLRAHRAERASDESVQAALERVELGADPEFGHRYPHQLSGGQQQRVTIAMASVCEPPVAVLDEPTTGLDVLTQDRILTELARLRDEDGMAMVYVSHDLAVVAKMADRIVVMYAGRVVENGPAAEVIERPRHPYTRALVCRDPGLQAPARPAGHPRRLGRRRRVAGRVRVRAALPAPAGALPRGGAGACAGDVAARGALRSLGRDRRRRTPLPMGARPAARRVRRGGAARGGGARGALPLRPQRAAGGGRRLVRDRIGSLRRAGRRVGQRQDDRRPLHRRAARAHGRPDRVRRR